MSSRAEVEPVSSTRSDPLNPEVEAQPLKQRMVPLHWHKVAAISGVAAVGLGAYGSHLFNPKNPVYKEVWQTASVYHLAHSVALLAAPITKRPNIFGGLLTAGVIAFSGSSSNFYQINAASSPAGRFENPIMKTLNNEIVSLVHSPSSLYPIECYAAALLEDRKYSALAPFGGFAFMAAWASLLF
ncbi:hypothetical protein L484_019996 [Morus notabilis]|uniref:Transmembrane protein 256-like protein n=1 Tax=Morus notabilis TaxID=981085 RepID=W9SZS6_9ROSA|nr:hypothetical protein L484_019996 [Morus notabilis]